MSDATRAVALSEAIKLAIAFEQGAKSEILDIARSFDDFLNDAATPATKTSSAAGKEPAKPTATKPPSKPATGGKKPAVSEDETIRKALEAQRAEQAAADAAADENEATAPTTDDVQAVIAKLLAAGLRNDAVKLLKKYGAASATGVKGANIPKFVAEATKLLPADEAADDGADADLTA
jgi:hypothetical protein